MKERQFVIKLTVTERSLKRKNLNRVLHLKLERALRKLKKKLDELEVIKDDLQQQ